MEAYWIFLGFSFGTLSSWYWEGEHGVENGRIALEKVAMNFVNGALDLTQI